MARKALTASQISDLIAEAMRNCGACQRISAPLIVATTKIADGLEWETFDWRGDKRDIARCQSALAGYIKELQTTYVLVG